MGMDSNLPNEFHTYAAFQEAETAYRLAGMGPVPDEMTRYARGIEYATNENLTSTLRVIKVSAMWSLRLEALYRWSLSPRDG